MSNIQNGSEILEHVFFFQAEDGIRDYKVTGVQTCALPILRQFFTAATRFCKPSFFGMSRSKADCDTKVRLVLHRARPKAPNIGRLMIGSGVGDRKSVV